MLRKGLCDVVVCSFHMMNSVFVCVEIYIAVFRDRNSKNLKHSESADLLGQGRSLLPYCPL